MDVHFLEPVEPASAGQIESALSAADDVLATDRPAYTHQLDVRGRR